MKRFEMNVAATDQISVHEDMPQHTKSEEVFRGSLNKLKDYLFDQYMKQQLLEDFLSSLSGYLSDENVEEARRVFAEYSEHDIYAALSLPYELRERRFEQFEKDIDSGKSVKEVITSFVNVSASHGFGVGYHCSPLDIRPDDDDHWMIKGTEADHRDGDRLMAYYSSQYRHLYKKRHPKFVYIIRTDPTHKTDGNWSRADSLSVIARVPFEDVENYVRSTAKEIAAPSQGVEGAADGA